MSPQTGSTPPHLPQPNCSTSPTQTSSHWVSQQYASWAQTQALIASSPQPGPSLGVQQSDTGQSPQSAGQLSHVSCPSQTWSPQLPHTNSPPWHTPSTQTSPVVHSSPSLQATSLVGVLTQPAPASHLSSVQGLASSHFLGAPAHCPFWHLSMSVQVSPSEQDVPFPLGDFWQTPDWGLHLLTSHGPRAI